MSVREVASRHRVVAHVDLAALRHNLAQVRGYAPRSRVMAAVKADAYGHGAVAVSRALSVAGVDSLAVACVEEALVLRRAQITTPLVLLEGVTCADEAEWAVQEGIEIVLHTPWQWELLAAQRTRGTPKVWIKLDTGMHRLGFVPERAPELARALGATDWALQGWMTHLACADEPDHPLTRRQLDRFAKVVAGLPGARSIANSAALIAWPETRVDWVRPGLALYGSSPFAGRSAGSLGLRAVMHLESFVLAIREIEPGESVGYGATWTSPRRARIGVVAAGYADGLPRRLPAGTLVGVDGRDVGLVGRVSMDMITIDLTELPQVQPGTAVTLWGPARPAEDMAERAGTVSYELFCGLTRRVHFRYRNAG